MPSNPTPCETEERSPVPREKIEILKAMAHPVRVMILEELARGVRCVSDFEDFLEIRQPNISQHLSVL